jgi:hypothetical protein
VKKKGEINVVVSVIKEWGKLRLKIVPMKIYADYGDRIIWQWDSPTTRVFSVQFGETPFEQKDYASQRSKISQVINYNPGKHKGKAKTFKYTGAAYYGGKVYIRDPVIIVPKPPKA